MYDFFIEDIFEARPNGMVFLLGCHFCAWRLLENIGLDLFSTQARFCMPPVYVEELQVSRTVLPSSFVVLGVDLDFLRRSNPNHLTRNERFDRSCLPTTAEYVQRRSPLTPHTNARPRFRDLRSVSWLANTPSTTRLVGKVDIPTETPDVRR